MLIMSERVTLADRLHWDELDASDFVYAESRPLEQMAQFAMRSIAEFREAGPCYLGISWGKDSVVVAHLVAMMGIDIPCVYFVHSPRDNPDCNRVRDAFLSEYSIDYSERVVDPRQAGDTSTKRKRYARWEAEAGLPYRRITGIRADESPIREISAWTHGISTEVTCRPILRWSTPEVFAYLASRYLPVHPAYAQSRGGLMDRNWLRVAPLGGKEGTGHGRSDWEREYYGDVLNRIAAGLTG